MPMPTGLGRCFKYSPTLSKPSILRMNSCNCTHTQCHTHTHTHTYACCQSSTLQHSMMFAQGIFQDERWKNSGSLVVNALNFKMLIGFAFRKHLCSNALHRPTLWKLERHCESIKRTRSKTEYREKSA
jgi:hypothetical protein